MAASINVCDNIYTVQPVNQNATSSLADDTGVAVVPGPFRWTVWSVVPTPNKQPAAYSSLSNLGFQYMEESLSCNITDARFTYYLKPRPKFKKSAGVATRTFFKTQFICAVISIHQPRAYNQSPNNADSSGILISLPKFASKFYGRLEQFVFSSARRLSFEKFNLDNVQSLIPSDAPKRLESTDITQLEISLKKMAFVPSPKSTLNTPASIRNYQMEGSLYLGNTSELTDPWPAFMNIKFIESTFFIITFKEDIEVRLIMNESNLLKMPSALSLLFSEQLEILSWLVDSTGSDLHNRSFGLQTQLVLLALACGSL
ncbi:hypothetical protein PGTUg99_036161 [Puccinia graminis f. sp. tritici]|nr:hypothetical protein PGTUg99_036161 [Puccinia graminis f. sp. tritici]